jgi:hypothetical protein
MVIVYIYAILRVYSRQDTHRSNPFAANGGRTDDATHLPRIDRQLRENLNIGYTNLSA